jgi:hypothetical protein
LYSSTWEAEAKEQRIVSWRPAWAAS